MYHVVHRQINATTYNIRGQVINFQIPLRQWYKLRRIYMGSDPIVGVSVCLQ